MTQYIIKEGVFVDKANLNPNGIGNKILKASITPLPMVNLRMEFKQHYNFLKKVVDGEIHIEPTYIQDPYMIWTGMPDEFFSLILQRAILGVESYVPRAVLSVLFQTGTFKEEYTKYIQNPFCFTGKHSTPHRYYNLLPALIDEDLTLKKCSDYEWPLIEAFYKKVRNPLFHGNQIQGINSAVVDSAVILDGYDVLNKIYEWVDMWYALDSLWEGAKILQVPFKK